MVCALVAGAQTTWGLVIPVLPVYADRLGAGAATLGVVVAAFGLGRLVVGVPAGVLAQRTPQRALLLTATAALALVTLATVAATSLGQLVALRALTGLAGGVVMTAGQAYLTDTDPALLGRTMATLQSYHIVGGALGPAVGGLVVGVDDRLPFLIGGVGLTLVALAGLVRIPATPAPGRRHRGAPPPGAARLWNRALVGMCLVSFTIFFFRFGGQQFLVPLLAYQRAGLTPAQFGASVATVTVAGLLLVGLAGVATDRWGRRLMVCAPTALLGLASLGFLGADHPAAFLATLVATGVFIAAGGPATGAYLADCAPPHRRGLAVGLTRTAGDAATLLGPPVLGWLVATGDTATAVVVLAALTTLTGLVFAWLSRTRPAAPTRPADHPPTVAKENHHAGRAVPAV